MNNKIKDYLGITAIIAVIGSLILGAGMVRTYSKTIEPSTFRSFSVNGEGKVVVIPDVAKITFSVISEGEKDLAVLQKSNTEKTNKAIEFVKSNGVGIKDIKTEGYSVSPRYQYFSCPSTLGSVTSRQVCPLPEIIGYSVVQTIGVKIRDFTKIGVLISGVVGSGANSVSELNFTIDDLTEVENQARAEAIVKAKAKARSIADAGDFSLGKLLAIEEGGYGGPIYRDALYSEKATGFGGEGLPAPSIEPGSQDVIINVVLRYEIR
jgi:uncharacterized protein YggE